MDSDGTERALQLLDAARRDIGGKMGWLAVQAIAKLARDAEPEIAWISLSRCQEGDAVFMAPGGYYSADGTDLAQANPPAAAQRVWHAPRPHWRDAANLDDLTARLRPFCRYLDQTDVSVWQDVATELDADGTSLIGDGGRRLYISLTLSLDGPARAGATLPFPDLRRIDARREPQPHPCAGSWAYEGVNGGGHEVFICAAGHRLIAPHPSGLHLCTSACFAADVTAPYPA